MTCAAYMVHLARNVELRTLDSTNPATFPPPQVRPTELSDSRGQVKTPFLRSETFAPGEFTTPPALQSATQLERSPNSAGARLPCGNTEVVLVAPMSHAGRVGPATGLVGLAGLGASQRGHGRCAASVLPWSTWQMVSRGPVSAPTLPRSIKHGIYAPWRSKPTNSSPAVP
jgi:hypothetical protein